MAVSRRFDKVAAIAIISIVIALIAIGAFAYSINKLNNISKTQNEMNKKLEQMSSGLESMKSSVSNITVLSEDLNALSASLNNLYKVVESLKGNQTAQSENVKNLLQSISSLEKEINTLKERISFENISTGSLKVQIENIEKRIDSLYNLLLYPVTIVDATGKPVTISKRPTRIISLLPSVTEILWAVNASRQVIAVDEYSNYPPQVLEEVKNGTLVNIGSGWYPNVELILSLKPDLVIGVDSVPSHHTLKKMLAEYGIPVVLLPDKNFEDVVDSIIIVGRLTGHPAEAAALATKLREEAVSLRTWINSYLNTTKLSREKVALVVWPKPLWVAGNSTFEDDIIKLAGGVNAYSYISGWQAVNPETLLKVDPDVIVVTLGHEGINMTRSQFVSYLKGILGNAVYNITAVKYNRIFFVVGDYNDMLVRPGPRIVEAAKLLAVLLYPNAFNLTSSQIPELLSPQTFKLPKVPFS